ncbi:MAG: UTP--glucose-1-phosphate uridylyltransferase [Subdoligranulum sp.]|nr:UTP--glucose-1-phosphate uridylyltransferase [Subdoligranulum sp.]
MQKVKKAVIPVAGFGTRMLPATKAMPKAMLPIVDKPAIQYIVEEAVAAGIEEILLIVGRGGASIEDHFDRAPELEAALQKPGKEKLLADVRASANLADIFFLRQKETKGLGHAILMARAFTQDEPFVVLYGDDVIMGEDPVAAQLCRAYTQYGRPCVGIREVPRADIAKYSSMKLSPLSENLYHITDMIEKPAPGQEFSLYSILGRCLLTPEIYDILEQTQPGAGGEIQLTDAMAVLARTGGMTGVDFTGRRYDMGNKLGVMQAQVETALRHPEIGDAFRDYLRRIAQTL